MKKFFYLRLRGGCGIPKVTLDGTLEDLLYLQEKVVKLRDLGLELDFWLNRLEPIITQFKYLIIFTFLSSLASLKLFLLCFLACILAFLQKKIYIWWLLISFLS